MAGMSIFLNWILAFQLFLLGYVSCLASPLHSRRQICVVSTNKNGGASEIFTFDDRADLGTQNKTKHKSNPKLSVGSVLPAVRSGLRSTFLPSGYPEKVPRFYLRYAIWSWIQDLSTQLRGVLATQRVLEGVGVGREGATALSAMLNFLVRDGCGMVAILLFTATTASRFQGDVKKWRLFADIMVDIGITLEVAAAQVPRGLFLPMLCVGNMCKAMCGVAGGAVGGAINLYWAEGTDISDIAAKFGAQQTVTASLGLISAAILARSISNFDPAKVWALYLALTMLHIFANVRCMRLIAFRTFNIGRLRMIFHEFWEQSNNGVDLSDDKIQLSTPRQIAAHEPLLFFASLRQPVRAAANIHFGVSFKEMICNDNKTLEGWVKTSEVLKQIDQQPYWISGGLYCRPIKVALNAKATPEQTIQAYFSVLVASVQKKVEAIGDMETKWLAFCRACETAGWDLGRSSIASEGYEVVFQDHSN